ncbi:MAG: GAF domain-containing protein [Chloroflexi bacterium]|nr:GAF domain-containing protein [Chloroflexota bacterium]
MERAAHSAPLEPPLANLPLYRFGALRVFAAVLLIMLGARAAEHWLQPGPAGAIGLGLAAGGLLIGVLHLLLGRRLWALVRANQQVAAGELAAAVLPVARIGDEIDLIVAWRNYMLRRVIAVSEENARLYARTDAALHQRLRELEILYGVTRALVAVPDLDGILHLILERLAKAAGARRGAMLLLTPDAGRFEMRTAFRLPHEDWAVLEAHLSQTMLQRDDASGAVTVSCDPLVLDGAGALPTRLCFPLQTVGRTIGAVYLERAADDAFDQERMQLLSALADDAALAIERARLAEAAARVEAYRQADALKSEFLANVSHDLKTPLTFIYGMAELLAVRPSTEQQRAAHLREIIAQAERMIAMLDELLDAARLEGEKVSLQIEALDVGRLLAQVAALFADRAPKHPLIAEAAPTLPPVLGDQRRLTQVLENLVSNAIRYSPDGGTVTLRAWCDQDRVVIAVEDQGIGIPAEELPRIFERFYRVRSREPAGIPGTGLGLAIVDQLVRAHGGTVEVRSQVGRGSVFQVRLPAGRPADSRLRRRS